MAPFRSVSLHLMTIEFSEFSVGENATADGSFSPLVWPCDELPSIPACGYALSPAEMPVQDEPTWMDGLSSSPS